MRKLKRKVKKRRATIRAPSYLLTSQVDRRPMMKRLKRRMRPQ
jgi:hypothetical protein